MGGDYAPSFLPALKCGLLWPRSPSLQNLKSKLDNSKDHAFYRCGASDWIRLKLCSVLLQNNVFVSCGCLAVYSFFRRHHGNEKSSPESNGCPDGDPDFCAWRQENREDLRYQDERRREKPVVSRVHLSKECMWGDLWDAIIVLLSFKKFLQ